MNNAFTGSTKKTEYSDLIAKNTRRKSTSIVAAISEPSIPFILSNTSAIDCKVYPPKVKIDETFSPTNTDKEYTSSELIADVVVTKSDDVFPLEAQLAETSKVVQVKVSLSKEKQQTSTSTTISALKKFTPTRLSNKQTPKTPHSHKKFVTPTASAWENRKYFCMTPDPSVGSIVDVSVADSFQEYSRQAKSFSRASKTPFHMIVHAMVTNATFTVPSVLHWNDAGDRFVVQNVVCPYLFFVKLLWRKSQTKSSFFVLYYG